MSRLSLPVVPGNGYQKVSNVQAGRRDGKPNGRHNHFASKINPRTSRKIQQAAPKQLPRKNRPIERWLSSGTYELEITTVFAQTSPYRCLRADLCMQL